jgi:hypothetical protein
MNAMLRNFVVPACVVALGAAAIVWNLETKWATGRKFAQEVKQYQSGAQRGDANSEFELGRSYFWGRGVPRDYTQAAFWCQKAADQGFAKAEYAIGNMYYYGNGYDQSYSNAIIWYHKAADQDVSVAQFAIASMYYHGFGVSQSYPDTMVWYRKAADQGYARAESGIGYLYWNGLGVEKDRAEANRWYRRAASHGEEDAQRWLGLRLPPCGIAFRFVPFLGFAGGLLFLIDFFKQKGSLHEPRLRKAALLSLILLLWSGMDWFQYSKYGLFPSAWAAYSFKAATFFLSGISVPPLVTVLRPKAGKAMLILSGLLFVAENLALCAKARFDLGILSALYWRFIALDSFPLGMAISAAIQLWRRKREPADGASEPPSTSGEVPDAV